MRRLKLIALIVIAFVFLLFGIELFKTAYTFSDPFHFLVYLFASNLVILISAALILGFILHLKRELRPSRPSNDTMEDTEEE